MTSTFMQNFPKPADGHTGKVGPETGAWDSFVGPRTPQKGSRTQEPKLFKKVTGPRTSKVGYNIMKNIYRKTVRTFFTNFYITINLALFDKIYQIRFFTKPTLGSQIKLKIISLRLRSKK